MNSAAKQKLLADFVLRPCQWDETAAAWSRLIPRDNPAGQADELSNLVKTGAARCYEVISYDGERRCLIVVGVDKAQNELVIYAAYAPENHRDLMDEFLPELRQVGRELGCKTVRFHTMRPGLVAKALNRGWRICEVIVRDTL